jgi:tRNA pseudouridine13 synthase
MRYRVRPADFRVEEIIHLPTSRGGSYTLYRVHKIARTTLQVKSALARALGCPPAVVNFPALKDRHAVADQYASARCDGPAELRGKGWTAHRAGRARRALRSGDLRGNRFTVVLRDLAADEGPALAERFEHLAQAGLPNYFDQQRFGSYSPGQEWIGKTILRADAEGALRVHLGQDMVGDPARVVAFKAEVREHWGDWDDLFSVAPAPSNFRSVLVFLRDHPTDFRRALNLVTPRVLSIYLAAYQSLLWNRLVGRFLREQGDSVAEVEVAGEALPFYGTLPDDLLQSWRALLVPLPHHRVAYVAPWDALFQQALAEEGLQQTDLKARLLRRAYLSKGKRALLLFPQETAVREEAADERFSGRRRLTVRFTLPPGAYATLVLRAMDALSRTADSPAR